MSDDLISRKALLEVIDISFIIPILKMNLRPEHEAVLKIREIIMNMPTAFDKEKVLSQISSEATDANDNAWGSMGRFDYWGGVEDGLNNAYDIVERGGIDG